MPDPVLLAFALFASLAGMGWLAMANKAHWAQIRKGRPISTVIAHRLRWQGGIAMVVSLVLCLWVDHPTMAVLVWVMLLAAAALTIAMILTWRARWLRVLPIAARRRA